MLCCTLHKKQSLTFELGRRGFGGGEGVNVREGALPSIVVCLDPEVKGSGLAKPLDFVGVAGAAVNADKSTRGERPTQIRAVLVTDTQVSLLQRGLGLHSRALARIAGLWSIRQ